MAQGASSSPDPIVRVGHGYDLHRLEPRPPTGSGRMLVIAGVTFEQHDRGPISHSDGDVAAHAVTDALLGALGRPDIGESFPDTDPRFAGASSRAFVEAAAAAVREDGYVLANLDVTVICEHPKIGPVKRTMIDTLAAWLGVDASRVNLKGKTHERVDAVGEGRAIEAHAVVSLVRDGRGLYSGDDP
ncbi:MAG: 2-C-methyl-D-erythritol 2,4-cyclodiphosphate synthase [Phycisphaerales bacterium]|nr:2-C-methyl-D-erythritol 2,4-cyclodiphosphate synthase [Phycisphaerales bacterium]